MSEKMIRNPPGKQTKLCIIIPLIYRLPTWVFACKSTINNCYCYKHIFFVKKIIDFTNHISSPWF